MQPEAMAEDEVNNVSLCHNDNYVTISNDPRSGHGVVLLSVSCPFACCVSLILFFCLSVESLSLYIFFFFKLGRKKNFPPIISGAFKLCHQNQAIMPPVLVVCV